MLDTARGLDDLIHAARAGEEGALEAIAAATGWVASDHDLQRSVEELVGNGRADLATRLLAACEARQGFSQGIIATAHARILAATGRMSAAIDHLAAETGKATPHIAALRSRYLMMEHMLDFAGARQGVARAALLYGEDYDLSHAVEQLIFTFDWAAAEALLGAFTSRHPTRLDASGAAAASLAAARSAADAALAAHGSADAAAADEIFALLSKPGVPPLRVLWAKQALVSLINSDRLTEAAYQLFAWYLPNWEDGLIRGHILSAARARIPGSLPVQRGWLHYLITQNIYGDAARQCRDLMRIDGDADTIFFGISLLRLQNDEVAPSFMDRDLFDQLRGQVFAAMANTEAGFRCVMHDHIVALGGPAQSWPDDAILPPSAPEALGLRRLFAVTTGRLGRVSATVAPHPRAPIRPVLALSGQLRGFETCWSSIHRHLCQPSGAPVIVSVWDKSANATGRHARRLERALPDDILRQLKPEERYTDAFERAYPQTFGKLFGQTDVDAADVLRMVASQPCDRLAVETESERQIEQILPPHFSSNMLKMYYKFARLEALLREAESASGEMFSHVIWSRPDCQIVRLSPFDLKQCLSRRELVWSSFTTETAFGDYVMILPRRAFAAIAAIFPRVVTAGDSRLLPWRPNRADGPGQRSHLDAFGGPDVLFDTLLAAGYNPIGRIPRMVVDLVGRTPGHDVIRRSFAAERLGGLT